MNAQAVGIAGYMGAGKSSAARILAGRLHAAIIDADGEAKRMMSGDARLIERLAAEFGPSIVEQDRLSFSRLGAIVFRSVDDLQRLNRIVHPPLLQRLSAVVGSAQGGCYILDAALIPLWGIESWFGVALWIDASRDTRAARMDAVLTLSRQEILERCAIQERLFPPPSGAPWRIVENNGSLEELAELLDAITKTEGDRTGAY